MVHAVGRERRDALRQRKRGRMAVLERRREIELAGRGANCSDDLFAAMARVHAPQSRAGIEQRAPRRIVIMHPFRAHEHARGSLEAAIGRERHPERAEIIGTHARLRSDKGPGEPGPLHL
jgi:hypothetical protein